MTVRLHLWNINHVFAQLGPIEITHTHTCMHTYAWSSNDYRRGHKYEKWLERKREGQKSCKYIYYFCIKFSKNNQSINKPIKNHDFGDTCHYPQDIRIVTRQISVNSSPFGLRSSFWVRLVQIIYWDTLSSTKENHILSTILTQRMNNQAYFNI